MTSPSVTTRARVVLPPVLRTGTAIPPGARLTTDHPDIDLTAGVITSRAAAVVVARITVAVAPEATDTCGATDGSDFTETVDVTEMFDVTVLPADAPVLLAGTRRPDPDPAVYAPRIAFSLHLTLATADGAVVRLNDDRGILFPRAVPTEHADTYRVRTLTDPWVFAVSGGYAVVASPALPDGSPEPSTGSSVLLFSSPDLITYQEIGLVEVAAHRYPTGHPATSSPVRCHCARPTPCGCGAGSGASATSPSRSPRSSSRPGIFPWSGSPAGLSVFHAHPTITTRGRCSALRRIHWAADGHLVLDQRPDEEVAPHLRRVRTVVHVSAERVG